MPIAPDKPPRESLQALRAGIETAPNEYRPLIHEVLAEVPKSWPHRIYCAGLEEIAAAQGLAQAALLGWRYLVRSGSDSDRNYAIEVQMDSTGQHHFAKLDKGPYIDGMNRLIHDPILAQELGATTFTPAVVRINALAIVAVWLRHPAPEKELIIPLSMNVAPWKKYSIPQFLANWQAAAQDKLAQDFSDG